jgi:hypothetical protein
MAVGRTLMDHDDRVLNDLTWPMLNTAKPHEAHPRYLRQTVPGIGTILRLVRRYEMPTIAGKCDDTSGAKIGHAYLTWTFCDAAVLCLRATPAGHTYLARFENKHGTGKA